MVILAVTIITLVSSNRIEEQYKNRQANGIFDQLNL